MNPTTATAANQAAALSTPVLIGLVIAVVLIVLAATRWSQNRPTLSDALNEALAHPEPVHATPVELIRDKCVPKPVSDAELRAVVDAHRAGSGAGVAIPTIWSAPSPTPTSAGFGTAGNTATGPPAPNTPEVLASAVQALQGLRQTPPGK